MELLIQKLISSAIQIIIFSLVPFIWWLVTARKKCGFFEWIGIKKIGNARKNKTFIWTLCVTLAFLAVSVFMLISVKGVETATSEFAGLGVKAVPAIIVYALFNTALPEEILFRGFLLKRIANKFGFGAGNLVQSIIFGLMHGIMFFGSTGVVKAVVITAFTGTIAWFMGFINEKKAEGSIIPSWTVHAAANIFSSVCTAFVLL